MIKLKIGDNYLITTNQDKSMKDFVIYTMSCFEGHNKVLLGFDFSGDECSYDNYIKAIKTDRVTELYILINTSVPQDLSYEMKSEWITYISHKLKDFRLRLLADVPQVNFMIIDMRNGMKKREYKIAKMIYEALQLDNKNILSHIDKLDEYKLFANRFKAIPEELKVIDSNIKAMTKEHKICDRKICVKDLEYLNLIDNVKLEGSNLVLDIKPLPIYPSEPFGRCIAKRSFVNNKYLAKATEYLYKGYHFGMVGTRVLIHPDFRPEFIETRDHRFDDMFARHNWSTIGYLHFGLGHLCGGEFNDVMAHTAEHGLEYYFMCFKQYITTANMRDIAGVKVWWYPIFDDNGKIIYCAGLDILRDAIIRMGIPKDEEEKILNMSWEDFIKWKERHDIVFRRMDLGFAPDGFDSYQPGKDGEDSFLAYCREYNPSLYEELTKEGAK